MLKRIQVKQINCTASYPILSRIIIANAGKNITFDMNNNLLLHIESAPISVRPQQKFLNPRRCPAHLLTDCLQRQARAALDDQFIMYRFHNEAVPERLHGVRKVSRDTAWTKFSVTFAP